MAEDGTQVAAEEDDLQVEDVAIDPGQLEGKEKKVHEPKADTPRFKDVYGKMKDFERKFEASEEARKVERDELLADQEAMKEHNQQIAQQLAYQQGQIEKSGGTAPPVVDKIAEEITELEKEMDQAFEDEEMPKAIKLQGKINRLQIQSMKTQNINPDDIVNRVADTVAKQQVAFENNVVFNDWVSNNKWYIDNPAMRRDADKIGKAMLESGKTYRDTLKEVAKEVNKKFGKGKIEPTFASVEGGDDTPPPNDSGSTELTEKERRTAKLFDMTDEQMLRQVKASKAAEKRGEA